MAYPLSQAISETRIVLNDDTENVWTDVAMTYFVNEGIMIIKNTIPEYFTALHKITLPTDDIGIADQYTNLIVLFASARCFEQDDQDFKASKQMNEFEARRVEMDQVIRNSQEYADLIALLGSGEYVVDAYGAYDDYTEDEVAPLDP